MVKTNKDVLLNILLLINFLLLHYLFQFLNFYPVEIYKWTVVILLFYSVLAARKIMRVKWFNSYLIFIGTFALFLCSRIILDLLGISPLNETTLYIYYDISDKTICKSIFLIIISLYSLNIGFFLNKKVISSSKESEYNFIKPSHDISESKVIKKLCVFLLLMFLPGTLLKLWHDFQFVLQHGYLAIYSDFESAPVLYRFSWLMFTIIFPAILIFYKDKKTVLFWIVVMIILSLMDSLKGSRNGFIRALLFCGWFYYKYYNPKDVKIKYIVVSFALLLVFSQILVFWRSGVSVDSSITNNLLNIFLYQQGVSFTLIPIYLDFENQIVNPSKFYILYPLVNLFQRFFNPIFREGNSLGVVESTLSLDSKIMYAINPDAYLNGSGFGSTYILEIYALGGVFGVILLNIFIGWVIFKMEHIFYNTKYIWVSWIWITHLAWMSRGSFFPSLLLLFLTWLIVVFFKCIQKK